MSVSKDVITPNANTVNEINNYFTKLFQNSATSLVNNFEQLLNGLQGVTNSSNNNYVQISPTLATHEEVKLFSTYSSKSSLYDYELVILKQPKTHHRARYVTEGSRGSIKDRSGRDYPIVQLKGYANSIVKLQCFIGHDKEIGDPHLFYQVCRSRGKVTHRLDRVDGINIIELDLLPCNNMMGVLNCIGIIKERNADVEKKVRRLLKSDTCVVTPYEEAKVIAQTNKCRSAYCRMVFRCVIPETGEVLQVVSDRIRCTQPLGSPEIYKMSLRESHIEGGSELFIIGKNFNKDSKVVFTSGNVWRKEVHPLEGLFNSTHLVCHIPPYDAVGAKTQSFINAEISVHSNQNKSQKISFIYSNPSVGDNNVL